jgi:hypothetical protein
LNIANEVLRAFCGGARLFSMRLYGKWSVPLQSLWLLYLVEMMSEHLLSGISPINHKVCLLQTK